MDSRKTSIDERRVGSKLLDRYELIELIGRGGMGAVYKAKSLQKENAGEIVAVKMLLTENHTDTSVRGRFLREAKSVSKIRHPNVVEMLDFGEAENSPFIVIEYIDGINLAQLLRSEKYLTAKRAIRIFIQICEAVASAHAQGVIHRDIKPSNIMLINENGFEDWVKVLDFGLAKALDPENESQRLTKTGEIFGSPLYMSPEQCRGLKLDERTDIYSLGIVMYECLTGKPPFAGINIVETIGKKINSKAPTFSEIRSDHKFPDSLENIVQISISTDPQERYSSMFELRDELETCLNSISKNQKKVSANVSSQTKQNKVAFPFKQVLLWIFGILFIIIMMGGAYLLLCQVLVLQMQIKEKAPLQDIR